MAMGAAKIRSDMLKQTEKTDSSAKKKLAKIKARIRAGRRLTPDEKAFLKKYAPELYLEAVAKERDTTAQERRERKRRQEKETKRIREQKRAQERKLQEERAKERTRKKQLEEKRLAEALKEQKIADYTDKKKVMSDAAEEKVQEKLTFKKMQYTGAMDPMESEIRASEMSEAAADLSGHPTGVPIGRAAYRAMADMAELNNLKDEIDQYNLKA